MNLPAVAPPLPPAVSWNRHVAPSIAFDWLAAGWRDLTIYPSVSRAYGVLVFVVSAILVGGLVLFAGLLLYTLMLVWIRAAVIIYALFFGINPFPGLDGVAAMLFTTPVGWAMLIAGTAVGGIVAAFSFAISVFAIPMLLNERVDALTAMGTGWRWSGPICRSC